MQKIEEEKSGNRKERDLCKNLDKLKKDVFIINGIICYAKNDEKIIEALWKQSIQYFTLNFDG